MVHLNVNQLMKMNYVENILACKFIDDPKEVDINFAEEYWMEFRSINQWLKNEFYFWFISKDYFYGKYFFPSIDWCPKGEILVGYWWVCMHTFWRELKKQISVKKSKKGTNIFCTKFNVCRKYQRKRVLLKNNCAARNIF